MWQHSSSFIIVVIETACTQKIGKMSSNKLSIISKSTINSKKTPITSHTSNCCRPQNVPRRVIPSKSVTASDPKKSNTVSTKKCSSKPKKTTKSDMVFNKKQQNKHVDYCKRCGDVVEEITQNNEEISKNIEDIGKIVKSMNVKSVRNDNVINMKKKISKPIQQYFINDNFNLSTESVEIHDDVKKSSLDTIKEVSDLHSNSKESIFMVYSDSEEEITNLDPDDKISIEKLKEFRNKNYFECHSAKSRIKTKPHATNLENHKCVYRFYLNDRLFPVPLNTDHNNKVRCVECHLPMDVKKDLGDGKVNGTIQAKVKIENETQDMVLLLPINECFNIKERRKEERKVDDTYVYFGVVKLGTNGNSLFNKSLPDNSFALKYQKGYVEYEHSDKYRYKDVEENDVIVI